MPKPTRADPTPAKLTIDELVAFVHEDETGEGLTAFLGANNTWMPMVCSDSARVDGFRPIAQQLANTLGQPIKLLRFSVREQIDVIEPATGEQP